MKIAELPLATPIVEKLIETESFDTLNPPQEAVVKAGLFDRKNFLITIPTASGKTFIAEMCALQHIIEFKKQVVYLTPLKALALEKFTDFKRFKSLGIRVGITLGDFDSAETNLKNFDIIISTNEKIDSLLRHNAGFIQENISLLIVDECHLIDDASRGPTLETLIVKIKKINPAIQLLALSATVQNAQEIATWLNAELIQSTWRSVPVEEYFCNQQGVILHKKTQSTRTIDSSNILPLLVTETLDGKGQVLIFASSRKHAQGLAKDLKTIALPYISSEEAKLIKTSIDALKKKDQSGDRTSDSLLVLLKNGIGFHHAGLSSEQRIIVESLFKKRILKIIVATPTLAAGINLPARRVIIPSIWRFSTISGNMIPLKVMEYEQMRGRSGRPKYDPYGESFVLATSERDEELVLEKYFSDEGFEEIESKLSARNILRIHLLGVLATGIVKNYTELNEFLRDTFYGFKFKDDKRLESGLRDVISDLEKFGFIKLRNESIIVTRLGRRVSQLYIDPVSADILINGIIKSLRYPDYEPIMFVHLFSLVPDIRRIRLKKKDWGKIDADYYLVRDKLLSDAKMLWNFNFEIDIEAFKTALIFLDWIEEVPLSSIINKYDLTLGDFQRLHETLKWLSYSAKELAKELISILKDRNITDFIYLESLAEFTQADLSILQNYLAGLEIRLSEGIKEDLLKLIQLKGLGRIKARTLSRNGIKNLQQLRQADIATLNALPGFGPKLIQSLKDQLGQNVDVSNLTAHITNNFNTQNKISNNKKKNSSLTDYVKK